ncbi:dihydrolipoamide acetyltransferase family protein [Desulforhabdus sp. TSK]|uniref:dihydrolipoamide acetyltransferase family protein n=1 Tax=Desulforhabdus sp. TSK TaxID=2925014 RepID=UPI001FC846F3|nr:dihydrolipoamide acetyltransferase family protein [Desulforhabdus sp. TSK]GKT07773.1 acetyltransferase component of pyruvate dehydrogenase complex [Desulforhabdus sp. TSK]
MAEFRMPSLGSDMQEGTLLEWRVKPGDRVRRRDIIAVVDTDKAAIEIEVFEEGIVEEILVQPGEKVPVGTVLAIIRTEGEAGVVTAKGAKAAAEAALPAGGVIETMEEMAGRATPEKRIPPGEAPAAAAAPAAPPTAGRIKVSPYARRLAAERSIDLSVLKGTGPAGAIRAADVESAAGIAPAGPPVEAPPAPLEEKPPIAPREKAPPPPVSPTAEKPAVKDYQAAMRRAIAAAMARSNREIPHYYLQTRIDMSRTLRWLESENQKRSIKDRILPVVPLIKAVAMALTEVPELNGYWIDDRHQPQEAIHIGFAIALRQGGLITPAILNADLKSVDELMEALRDLVTRARSGGLRSSELTDATVTITSLGDLGVETVYGVIYPPQVALVGFGKTMEQPWAENGMLAVRPVLTATLAADHRATDGHRGAQFLDAMNRYLQEPSKL